MSFQPTSSSLFDMVPGSDKYIKCVEACVAHESTNLRTLEHKEKIRKETVLAHPCVLPVEDHDDGGHCNELVVCIVCNAGVKLRGASSWARQHWDEHTRTDKHKNNRKRYEALHGPLERVVKSAMPRYKAVWTGVGSKARLVPEVYVPHQGDMFSEHNDLIPITLA